MLYWVIQTTVISIIFILVVHNIFHFLKNTLTVPKAKDLVDVHMEKYKHIYATLKKGDESGSIMNQIPSSSGTTNIDDICCINHARIGDWIGFGKGKTSVPVEDDNSLINIVIIKYLCTTEKS